MFLTFPIMVIRVNTVKDVIEWRWRNLLMIGIGTFALSFIWRRMIERKEMGEKRDENGAENRFSFIHRIAGDKKLLIPACVMAALFAVAFPFMFSLYQTNIMITCLIYVVVALGLNIVVGLAGLLDLGYVAFYAVGAYCYALLNHHFGLGFWTVLPIGAGAAFLFGILLGFPVLRLRGDYLAIVTLGFGEIIRLVLENWNEFSFGPSGIANIPKPGFFGIQFSLHNSAIFIYFLMIALAMFTIFVVNRLENSRLGRAWIALREDEIACQAMGVDKTKTKLAAFALGATWAGMGGVVFAAKTTFINPASFTIWESIIILCIVVLGGMGSILGVITGAFILILLPEYLRAFSEYRMLVFGILLVMMMVFKPDGIISNVRRTYKFKK
ncbi:leucine/isoleucine/valine transporter subunit; membrane component of ABC superfamily [Candidatus Desulfarcum epimagneticum]|uniref:Leucine/isoleucine/valine transporter subunit membrane component of ABC superfamily n=1 Tax=uncultured Desulfobacteraceae bacterium TaxID=218296 RepID=A0A484HED1_9BACT|nr:leucine/isoleucine/valine transporter subunit; membrane component of ABC superfamily [uncultured Desulfobacteraceae bacterium]